MLFGDLLSPALYARSLLPRTPSSLPRSRLHGYCPYDFVRLDPARLPRAHSRGRALSGVPRAWRARDRVHDRLSRAWHRLHQMGHEVRCDLRSPWRLCEGVRDGAGRDESPSGKRARGDIPARDGKHGGYRARLRHLQRRRPRRSRRARGVGKHPGTYEKRQVQHLSCDGNPSHQGAN